MVTCTFRLPCKINTTMRRLAINLISFPRLKYMTVSKAPLFVSGQGAKYKYTIQELTDQIWSKRNMYANIIPEDGKYFAMCAPYRGSLATAEFDDENAKIAQKMSDDFITWIPNNLKPCICNIPTPYTSMTCALIANTTAIKAIFQKISEQYGKLYEKKTFLDQYKSEGLDESEMNEADKNLKDLITEYQDKQDLVVEFDDDDDESDTDEEEDDEEEDEDEDEDESF